MNRIFNLIHKRNNLKASLLIDIELSKIEFFKQHQVDAFNLVSNRRLIFD